jgi:hypothetical protein
LQVRADRKQLQPFRAVSGFGGTCRRLHDTPGFFHA